MDSQLLASQYVKWPWVDLGTHSNNPNCNVTLPGPMSNDKLVETIAKGRTLSDLVVGNADHACYILKDHFGLDPNAPLNGQKADKATILNESWTVKDISPLFDNRGFVRLSGSKESPDSYSMTTGE